MEIKDYVNFEEKFNKLIEEHKSDRDYYLIKDCPKIFSTVLAIASDRTSDGIVKMSMNSAISYFVMISDVLPEEKMGVKGYIDDFFICVCALRELLEYDRKLGEYLIKKHWTLEENYEDYLVNKYYSLIQKLEQKTIAEIMAFSGLGFVKEMIQLKTNPSKYSEQKIRDLQRKLYYLFYVFFNKPLTGKDEKRKFEEQIFGTDEFLEPIRS
jgi:uncharacterized membrane protein YkvA (DUF1232 family)